jgi:hypothetical protein
MNYKRKQKLILPGLQLRLTAWFTAAAAVGLLLQFFLFSSHSMMALDEFTGDPAENYLSLTSTLLRVLFITLGLVLPITVVVSILTSFRIAGPIYRFTKFLEAVERGEKPADCHIRKKDELKDFCDLLNRATAPLREKAEDEGATDEPRQAA